MLGFYQEFARDYAKISILMIDQLWSTSKEIRWGEAQQRFKKLKVALVTTLILDIKDPNEQLVLEMDANGDHIEAILIQWGCPISF